MTKTRIRKCTTFFTPQFKHWLAMEVEEDANKTRNSPGIEATLQLAQAITKMCVTGLSLGMMKNPSQPLMRECWKYLLGGHRSNELLLMLIERSSRVEIRVSSQGHSEGTEIETTILFFEKRKKQTGSLKARFDYESGTGGILTLLMESM